MKNWTFRRQFFFFNEDCDWGQNVLDGSHLPDYQGIRWLRSHCILNSLRVISLWSSILSKHHRMECGPTVIQTKSDVL